MEYIIYKIIIDNGICILYKIIIENKLGTPAWTGFYFFPGGGDKSKIFKQTEPTYIDIHSVV